MNARLKAHLLRRLRHDARLRAIESAMEQGLLASAGPERSGSAKDTKPPKHTRRKKAVVEEDDGFFFNAAADDDAANIPQRLSLGARLKGRTRLEAARMLQRLGLSLPVDDGGRGQPITVADILEAIRRGAVPQADEVAVMLLLADAAALAGGSGDAWRGVLRRRGWSATILSTVDGFQLRLIRMLKEGAFGGPIGVFNGYELSADLTDLPSRYERGRTIIVFRGVEDEKCGSIEREERAAFAARFAIPVLGIASSGEHLPARLSRSADRALETGPLTLAIIGDVLREVLGEAPAEPPTCLSGHLTEAQAASLSIHDLAAAVRPGLAPRTVLATLQRLAGAEGGAGRSGAGGRASGADRSGSWRGGSSFDSRGRGGRIISSGSEIIEPEVLQDAAAGQSEPMSGGVQDHAAPPLSVETLHGYGEARIWALDLKQDLALWQQGTLPWSQLSTRLLLSGPPGTGKTTFARALCNSLQLPLVVTSVSTWLEPGYLGDVIRRMRIAFEEALANAPAILFIDEIDGIGSRNRGGDYDDYWTGLINKLLELMDGSIKTEGLIIVGAANHPNVIDPAIRRSGRLETHVEIPLPDVDALVGILAHHLGNDFPSVVASMPEPQGDGQSETSQAHAVPPPLRPDSARAVRSTVSPTSTSSSRLPQVESRRC